MTYKMLSKCYSIFDYKGIDNEKCKLIKDYLHYRYALKLYNFLKTRSTYKNVIKRNKKLLALYDDVNFDFISFYIRVPPLICNHIRSSLKRERRWSVINSLSTGTRNEILKEFPELDVIGWIKNRNISYNIYKLFYIIHDYESSQEKTHK